MTGNNRSKEISNISTIVYGILEGHLDDIAKDLKSPMELSHFLTGLENRLAITLGLKMAKLELKEKQESCQHKFSDLTQIGWVPDIEIMGYACELCGFTKRK